MTVRRGIRLLVRSTGFGLLLLANGCLFLDPILGAPGPNKPPEITNVQPTPSTDPPLILTADGKKTFLAQAHDPDGQDSALFYEWTIDGALANSGFGDTTYNLDATTVGTGAHLLLVTVTDPLGGTASARWGLQIQ